MAGAAELGQLSWGSLAGAAELGQLRWGSCGWGKAIAPAAAKPGQGKGSSVGGNWVGARQSLKQLSAWAGQSLKQLSAWAKQRLKQQQSSGIGAKRNAGASLIKV